LNPDLAITPTREEYEEDRKEREKNESPGDYAHKYENAPVERYYEDGTAAVHLADGDHPAYSAPIKGDMLAEDSDAKFTKINGNWYVLDPDDSEKCWYTSKTPSAWQTVKETTGAVIENVVATKEDILNFKEQKDIDYAKKQLLEQGIKEDDPEYEAKFAEKYKNAKEQSDAVWGVALGDGAGELVSAFVKLKAFKYTSSIVEGSGNAVKTVEQLSQESVVDKLDRYLLNSEHPVGGSKAKWFEQALGFTKGNSADLAKQIVFNPNTAVETATTEFGVKYNQTITIVGANGRTIDVVFAWIKNNDGVVRLVTSLPTKK